MFIYAFFESEQLHLLYFAHLPVPYGRAKFHNCNVIMIDALMRDQLIDSHDVVQQ